MLAIVIACLCLVLAAGITTMEQRKGSSWTVLSLLFTRSFAYSLSPSDPPIHPTDIRRHIDDALRQTLGFPSSNLPLSSEDHSAVHSSLTSSNVIKYIDEMLVRASFAPIHLHDYAQETNGGAVYEELTTRGAWEEDVQGGDDASMSRKYNERVSSLRDDGRVGQCWLLAGSHGQLGISFTDIIHPSHIVIDHRDLNPLISRAPRRMLLWGVLDDIGKDTSLALSQLIPTALGRNGPPITVAGSQFALLVDFVYDASAPHYVQAFPIDPRIRSLGIGFGVVVLEVVDNWGGQTTCLYRVRIYGEPS